MDVEQLRHEHYNATLIAIKPVTDDLWLIRVRPDQGVLAYKPGQYTTLGLGYWEPKVEGVGEEQLSEEQQSKLIKRAYSMSYPVVRDEDSALVDPEELDFYEFYIALVQNGSQPGQVPALTPRLFTRTVGDRLFVGDKITGHYTLNALGHGDQVVFAATGTGEAPHNCMIAQLLRTGYPAPIVSIVCVRYERDLAYKGVHIRLIEQFPNYHYITLTTRESWNQGRKVYIQDFIASGALEEQTGMRLDPACTHVYLCGNPSMIGVPKYHGTDKTYPTPRGVVEILEARGFTADYKQRIKGNIHFEEYW
ncbi:MAG: ferredoxin--NADP reductase [Candidatus Latescibacteria bacterium]|nr:ferredoxin--NADP reductase [Candidatus Latescibacterota bacterium]